MQKEKKYSKRYKNVTEKEKKEKMQMQIFLYLILLQFLLSENLNEAV